MEGGSPLSAQLHVVSGAQEQGFNFIAVWKVRRRTSQHMSHLGPTFRDCAADTLGKAVHLSPRAFRQHVLTLPPPHHPCAALSPQPGQTHRRKGRCAENTVTSPLFSAVRKEGFMAIPTGISAGVLVGLQKLEFTALAIPGQNVEPMRTQVS